MIQVIGSVLVVVTAVLADACALLYGLGFRWWTHRTGWHLLSFMTAIGIVATLGTVRLLTGEPSWYEVARLVAFSLVPMVVGWRLVILIRALPGERRRRSEGRE
ncbi:hypothetical protein IMZ11_02255 [Microtetraspora sp. AC03309]|uniref:putative phage holin n=1 Tax=Microtetraspora sp. AC03309 TaxID=2779376 RepID=UPI001E62AE03|nr:hypothetical protein [Microtetraspora sp. AC03309]MCC5574463.1 hypothetical protein [Microtetraspora sp. AC03309]